MYTYMPITYINNILGCFIQPQPQLLPLNSEGGTQKIPPDTLQRTDPYI